ncbi:MAG: hypothetical protein LQ348_003883 [Seirophora lacunosa]|nr:MAG: hypothetical protein LQ348_003883 [Seirophora lacunosa]
MALYTGNTTPNVSIIPLWRRVAPRDRSILIAQVCTKTLHPTAGRVIDDLHGLMDPLPSLSDVRCPTCFVEFSFPGARELHWQTSSCRFKCTLCRDRTNYGSDQGLRDHWKDKHARLYCSACDKVCVNGRALRTHQCVRKNYCDPCRVAFDSDEALKSHFRTHHVYVRYCDGCRKMYQDQHGESKWHKRHCCTRKHDSESKDHGDTETKEEDLGHKEAENPKSGEKQKSAPKDSNSSGKDTKSGANESLKSRKGQDQHRHEKKAPTGSQRPDQGSKTRRPKGFPDLYGCLDLSVSSPYEEVVQAARRRRIEVHPDKVKKPGMTDEELRRIDEIAKEVGQAADILSDPIKRAKYDRELKQQRVRR